MIASVDKPIKRRDLIMLVKVYIKRNIKKGKEKELFVLIKELRSRAMNQEGYISGENLVSTDDPQKLMVVSTWQGLENWTNWEKSDERKKIEVQLEELQSSPTTCESFVFSKHRISVQKGFPDPAG